MRFSLPLRILGVVCGAISITACGTNSLLHDAASGPLGSTLPREAAPTWRARSHATQSQGTSVPWQRHDASASVQPFVSEGTGEFLSNGPPYVVAATPAGSDGVSLNLLNAPIGQAVKTVLGDILKVNYALSDKVSGNITVQTTAPVPKEALIDLFESALKANGAAIVRGDGFYRIVPAANVAQSGPYLGRDGRGSGLGVQVRIIPLRHISASEANKLIEPVVPQGAIARIDNTRNIIVMVGTARELADVVNLVSVFDVDWLKGMSFALFPLKTSDPEAIAKELETVFGLDKNGPLNGVIRFVPNKRLGSVLMISSKPGHLETARSWVQKLDRLAQDTEEQLFVYKIQNRSATELAALLSRVLSRTNPGQGHPASDVAPRYEPTVVASAPPAPLSTGAASAAQPRSAGLLSSGFGRSSTAAQSQPSTLDAGLNAFSGNADAATQSVPAGNKVVADESNNALLVMSSPKEYQRILGILGRMDVLPTQVMLEAMIVEVTLKDELKFGLKWFFEKNNGKFTLSDAVTGTVASAFPGFSYFFSTANVRLALDAVSGITKVNVVSAPSLMVLDNRKAILQVGDQVPIVTQTAQSVANLDSPIVNSISFRDTGVILAVTPRVNDAGRVVLEIEQEVSNVARTTSSGIDSPTIQQRRVKTTVVVADGEVLTLGGLIQERNNVSKAQVPILGDIPVLGAAFRNTTDEIDRTELLIFIRPLVVRDTGEARAVTEEFRSRIKLESPASQRGRDRFDRDATRILR